MESWWGPVPKHGTGADAGPGIPENARSKIFERFYRADNSRQAQGSGLGRALVKAIVQPREDRIVPEDNEPFLRARMDLLTACVTRCRESRGNRERTQDRVRESARRIEIISVPGASWCCHLPAPGLKNARD
ncbi:MAG: sensor histidine kinase [Gammaproteobacteria bacterium]|nr:sensor histidine kinase [Gammaproteobacteria bacterium]